MSATSPLIRATYRAEEVAALLGISPWSVYKAIREEGEISGVRPIWVGRRVVFPRKAIDELVQWSGDTAA